MGCTQRKKNVEASIYKNVIARKVDASVSLYGAESYISGHNRTRVRGLIVFLTLTLTTSLLHIDSHIKAGLTQRDKRLWDISTTCSLCLTALAELIAWSERVSPGVRLFVRRP